jgi:hypothetical protein
MDPSILKDVRSRKPVTGEKSVRSIMGATNAARYGNGRAEKGILNCEGKAY